MEQEFNKIIHIINLLNLVRDLSEGITDEDFKNIVSDDTLTEMIIELESMFHK